MKKLLLAVALAPFALGFSMANAQTEVTTDPVGFVKTSLASGSYSLIGANLTKPSVYGAAVESATANTITVSEGSDIGAALDSSSSYYLEITGGDFEGDRIDVASASGNVITLDTGVAHNTISDASAVPAGSTFLIREHYSFADLGGDIGVDSLVGGTGTSDSDQILTFEDGGFVVHFYGSDGNWYTTDGTFTNVNGKAIAPGTGVLFFATATSEARDLELLMLGSVRTNDIVLPLTAGYQIVSTGFPMDLSPADAVMTTEFFTGGTGTSDSDQILTFEDGGFKVHFLGSDGNWYTTDGTFTPVTADALFAAQGSALVFKQTADSDFRIANQVQ